MSWRPWARAWQLRSHSFHGCSGHGRTLREVEDLRHQLVSQGADLDAKTLIVEVLSHGLGVFAGRAINKGEVVASVPRRLVLEVPLASPQSSSAPQPPKPFAAAAGGNGQWYDVMGFPEGRAAVAQAAARLAEEYAAGSSSLLGAYCAALPSPDLQAWALAAVVTRNFALKGKVSSLGLLPFIDLFNHQSSSGRGRVPWTCYFQERHGCVVMVAERRILEGEELTFVYAAAPDAALLVQYGIPPAPGANFHNLAGLQVHSDVLETAGQRDLAGDWGWTDLTQPLLFTIPEAWQPRNLD
ncbi:unnamed protein product [Symbiodinium natans]|uniref:SET domain-containing protein n=1 Tax=Symbiodinium natans TaxID=878477 RepID=A0A812USS8_9DINO|nr:unnamed protein product [Symbiodinium natans]